jgi:hypothetical protein
MTRPLLVILAASLAGPVDAQVEFTRRVGVDFEHFGESYRITDDADTVATINDIGTMIGLRLASPLLGRNRFRLDADLHFGQETRRVRLDFEGRTHWGAQTFDVSHEARYRWFGDQSDYAVAGTLFEDSIRLACQRELAERWRLRARTDFDLALYQEPNEFNLDSWLLRPGLDARLRFRDLDEIGLGYRFGKRTVRDSTELDYWRHTIDADLGMLFGWTAALDVTEQIDRRLYEASSIRESSWEHRLDATFDFGLGERATLRLVHDDEVVRYDRPDELDFDFTRVRTGVQVEMHRNRNLDFSLMPLFAFLSSPTAPEEEFSETGIEFGVDWRLGEHTWINVSNEVGRRDYEVTATAPVDSIGGTPTNSVLGDSSESAFSDYVYNRLTAIVTADIAAGISANLFVNWEPQDHRFDRHDTDTRIVSGGVEYRF